MAVMMDLIERVQSGIEGFTRKSLTCCLVFFA